MRGLSVEGTGKGSPGVRFKREYLHSRSPDYTKGIFQSIGFKEFHAYLILSEEERASEAVSSEREMARRYEPRLPFVLAAVSPVIFLPLKCTARLAT